MKEMQTTRVLFADGTTPELLESRMNNKIQEIEEQYRKLNKDPNISAYVKLKELKFFEMVQQPYAPYRATVIYEAHWLE